MTKPSEIMDEDIIDELSPVLDVKLEDDNIPVFREKMFTFFSNCIST